MTEPTTPTAERISRIRSSFDAARLTLEPASTAFYDFLFERAPHLRQMFRDDLTGQGMKFMTTLGTIVTALDTPAELDDHLTRLAEFHGGIGVRAADFEPMGEALIDTFHLTLGDEFTAEDEAAWREAYALIARRMIARAGMT